MRSWLGLAAECGSWQAAQVCDSTSAVVMPKLWSWACVATVLLVPSGWPSLVR